MTSPPPPPSVRQRLQDPIVQTWVELRFADKPLSLADIIMSVRERADARAREIIGWIDRWVAQGLVSRQGRPATFAMAAPALAMANPPAPKASGTMPRHWTQDHPARQKLWTAARILKRFDRVTLQMAAGVSKGSVGDFLRLLTRARYLRRFVDDNGNELWGWIEQTGPRAPVSRRLSIDGNSVLRIVDRNHPDRTIDVAVRTHPQNRGATRHAE